MKSCLIKVVAFGGMGPIKKGLLYLTYVCIKDFYFLFLEQRLILLRMKK